MWRRRWIVLTVAVVAPVAAYVLSSRQTPVYEATSEVLLSNNNIAASLTGIGDTSLYVDPVRTTQTQADLASVPTVAERAVAAAKIKGVTAADLLAEGSVSPKGDSSDILAFSVDNVDPAVATKLANAYAAAYTSYRREIDTAAASRAVAEAQQHLARLRDQGDSSSALYQNLVTKLQTLQTMEALQTSNAYVIRQAKSAGQISPHPKRNAALALALGLILGIGLAFLRETLDTRIRSSDEIAHALHLPLLARLPEPAKRLASKSLLTTIAEPFGPAAESFRLLRTNIDFATLDRPARSILVTGALQGEGKSTTAANLAVTLARDGRRVMLVDLDLRQPRIHEFFGLDPTTGLTTVCLGEVALEEAAHPVVVAPDRRQAQGTGSNGNGSSHLNGGILVVLPSGRIPPDPGEFVGTTQVADLLTELQRRADVVVVDAPPLLSVVDALTLSSRVDGLLVVTRPTLLRRPVLRELRRVLETVPAAKLGFVLAGAEAEGSYGYGVPTYGYDSAAETETPQRVA